jgi:hypothetical protein
MDIRKRSLQDVLKAVEERVLDEEVDRLLALSEAELDRELERAGFDPRDVRALASEIVERVLRLQAEGLSLAKAIGVGAQSCEIVRVPYPKSSGSGPAL